MSGPGQWQSWTPPPGGPGPGAGHPPPWAPPPTRRRSRWLTIGLPVGVVALVAALVALVLVTTRAISTAVGPAQQVVDAYATALVEQRWDDAHRLLCDASAAEFSVEALATLYGQPPRTGYGVDGVSVLSSNGRTTGTATITFELEGGLRDSTTWPLHREGGAWSVCP